MINRRNLPLNALRAFEAVASAGGFRSGAETLNITQSAISRHIANLEALIGRPLFDRTGRSVRLSVAGALLLPPVRSGFDAMEGLLNRLDANRSIRIHMPPAFLGPLAMDVLRDFRRANPKVSLDVTSSHDTGMPAQNVDIAIAFQRAQVDDRVCDLLRPIHFVPLCAIGAGPQPDEPLAAFLARSELLNVHITDRPDDHLWVGYARAVGIELGARPGVTFATAEAAIDYARRDGGVMLGEYGTDGQIAHDGLIMPYDLPADLGYGYYMSMLPELLADPALLRLRKALIEKFGRSGPAIDARADS